MGRIQSVIQGDDQSFSFLIVTKNKEKTTKNKNEQIQMCKVIQMLSSVNHTSPS